MKHKLYRINLKVVESGKTLITQRVIQMTIEEYLPKLRRDFPDAVMLYVELEKEWEEDDEPEGEIGILFG